jgi:hypothetical protein
MVSAKAAKVQLTSCVDHVAILQLQNDSCSDRGRTLFVKVFEHVKNLEIKTCPASNLPQRDKGRSGQGLTADKMAECRWPKPQLVAQIEYAGWIDVNPSPPLEFSALRDDKLATVPMTARAEGRAPRATGRLTRIPVITVRSKESMRDSRKILP